MNSVVDTVGSYVPGNENIEPSTQAEAKKTSRNSSGKAGKGKYRLPSIKKRRVVLMLPEEVAVAKEI